MSVFSLLLSLPPSSLLLLSFVLHSSRSGMRQRSFFSWVMGATTVVVVGLVSKCFV